MRILGERTPWLCVEQKWIVELLEEMNIPFFRNKQG